VRYGDGAAKLEGATLAKFITVLDEYLGFYNKVNKRLRAELITDLLPKLDLSKRADFEGDKKTPSKKVEKLEKEITKLQKELQLKEIDSRFDEEHNLWELRYVNAQGAEHLVNWELASTPEYRQMIAKFKQIEPYMEPPFVVETLGRATASGNGAGAGEEEGGSDAHVGADALVRPADDKSAAKSAKSGKKAVKEEVEKLTARDLFDYVLGEGKKEFTVQRYKGLGEMTAPQLWETTMDPERRTLLSVKLEDLAECETIFSTLMGEDVESRRKFIEENALDVKNLDI
jgi:DNA gyrase subunit B